MGELLSGPLEMMYSWQALLCACAVVGLTKLVTAAVDVQLGIERRKSNRWLSIVILPSVTVVFGLFYAMLIPLRPETLDSYVSAKVESHAIQLLCYGAWGAACGQFATTLYDRVRDVVSHMTGQASPKVVVEAHRPDTEGATEERP
jgi:hypothetical protein